MKTTFMTILPLIATVLLATSCSKDDNSEFDNVVNNGQPSVVVNGQAADANEGQEQPNEPIDDVVTIPFSIRVSDGNSLSKISFSGTDGTSEHNVSFESFDLGKILTVNAVNTTSYSDVTGSLELKKDGKGYYFDGAISCNSTHETSLKNGTIKLTGTFQGGSEFSGYQTSTVSLAALMKSSAVKHKFIAKEFDYSSEQIYLLDKVAYFCIEVASTQDKFDLTIGAETVTFVSTDNKKFWIAVPSGTVVKGNLISRSGITTEAGKIYKANRTKEVDLGLSVLWCTSNATSLERDLVNWNSASKLQTAVYKLPSIDNFKELSGKKKITGITVKAEGKTGTGDDAGYTFSTDYGSIFMPSAGGDDGKGVSGAGVVPYYWGELYNGSPTLASFFTYPGYDPDSRQLITYKFSVRLVREIK
ncbi:MAG: hypothetical protein J6X05_08280 [Bacteroidales bacterium]|nr:hypothetical protein [Bacteroidales bacterium]